jgi:hydrogenase maturation protein HypF
MSAALQDGPAAAIAVNESARRWLIGGRVQGVGFRPFVYRLAHLHKLTGWVRNRGGEVEIYAEGTAAQLQLFGEGLFACAPPAAAAILRETRAAQSERNDGFRILSSTSGDELHVHVPADLFTCAECLAELTDPNARRYRYPFINCTQCGPRYTLMCAMPYDRPNTTLAQFPLCPACAAEYMNPFDRRFHAQPLACAACGPVLHWCAPGDRIDGNEAALRAALAALQDGRIVAMRGIGGYHLLCDAANEQAVSRLRDRKARPAKPLAVMLPWCGDDGLQYARNVVQLSTLEAAALCGSVRPILLAARSGSGSLAENLAPRLKELGVMLPYSALHQLLLADFGGALVATSANLSGEPVLTEPAAVESRLAHVADGFLHHNRPIARPADDPVVRVLGGVLRPVRLGRGTAPLELHLPVPTPIPILAVGAYLKTTVALAWDERVVISPHIGELSSPRGREVFAQVAHDLQQLYGVHAECIAHDAHPDFPNARWARDTGLPTHAVWHHYAHAAAVAGEYPSDVPLLCFAWDGHGLGPDGSMWGGEALLGRPGAWRHVASWRPFRLPGGESAARAPWRSALGLSWESGLLWEQGASLSDPLLRAAWERGLNAPTTTSVGRLFDAAAALLGVCLHTNYEGQAPMQLEALCSDPATPLVLPLERDANGIWRTDWAALLPALLDNGVSSADRAALFHASLAEALCGQARALREETGVGLVGLCGGVFQNRVLTELVQTQLAAAGFEVLVPQRLPVNDAAISFGQTIETAACLSSSC